MKYTEEQLKAAIKLSKSLAETLRKLNVVPIGGNYYTLKKNIQKYNISTKHFTGLLWSKGIYNTEKVSRYSLSDILKNGIIYSSDHLKKRLIAEGIKENKCECCGLSGEEITLELHHINSCHTDNRLENLQILCPNCHSKTPNHRKGYKDKNAKRLMRSQQNSVCENCGKIFSNNRTNHRKRFCCRECYTEFLAKVGTLNKNSVSNKKVVITEEFLKALCEKHSNIKQIADETGYTRPSIRKYLDKYGLLEEFKYKYDFHSVLIELCDTEGNLIKVWPSISDAANSLNIGSKDISACINFKRRSAGGYLWKRKET